MGTLLEVKDLKSISYTVGCVARSGWRFVYSKRRRNTGRRW